MKHHPGRMLGEVLAASVSAPATVAYPAVKAVLPVGFRGRILFHPERCIGCKLCMKDCPALAIEIREVAKKRYAAFFHLDRCIYCAQCVDSCNKNALEATNDIELAALTHEGMKVFYDNPPPVADEPDGTP